MANDLRAFMAQNVIADEEISFIATKRICDEKGIPVEWILKSIDSKQDEQIRRSCTKKIANKRGASLPETDINEYLGKMVAACIVYPNLNDKALQDSYSAMGASELIKMMLKPGEFSELVSKVQSINGFDLSMEEMVSTAKNS